MKKAKEAKLSTVIRDLIRHEKLYCIPTLKRSDLIQRLGVGRALLIDTFRNHLGMSFSRYINSLRLEEALKLLENPDFSIEEVSRKSGFGTSRSFRRQFNAQYGISPADYRRKLEEEL